MKVIRGLSCKREGANSPQDDRCCSQGSSPSLSESTGGQFETSQFGNRGMWLTGISMAKKINMAAAVGRAVLCSGFLKWRLRFKRTLARL